MEWRRSAVDEVNPFRDNSDETSPSAQETWEAHCLEKTTTENIRVEEMCQLSEKNIQINA
jgi:hypothetical protein